MGFDDTGLGEAMARSASDDRISRLERDFAELIRIAKDIQERVSRLEGDAK